MVDQRKYESRDARAYSSTYGYLPADGLAFGSVASDAEDEARRGQHGHHGPRDALLESLSRLAVDRFGDRHQAVERAVVDRAAERPGREPAQDLPGILPALGIGLGRLVPGEKPIVVRLLVSRPSTVRAAPAATRTSLPRSVCPA